MPPALKLLMCCLIGGMCSFAQAQQKSTFQTPLNTFEHMLARAAAETQSKSTFQTALDDFEQALARHRKAIAQHDAEVALNATLDKALQGKAPESAEFKPIRC